MTEPKFCGQADIRARLAQNAERLREWEGRTSELAKSVRSNLEQHRWALEKDLEIAQREGWE